MASVSVLLSSHLGEIRGEAQACLIISFSVSNVAKSILLSQFVGSVLVSQLTFERFAGLGLA